MAGCLRHGKGDHRRAAAHRPRLAVGPKAAGAHPGGARAAETAPAPRTTDPSLRFGASPTTEHAPPCLVRRGRETERRIGAPPFFIHRTGTLRQLRANRHHGRIHRHHHQHAGNRPRLARAERAGHPRWGSPRVRCRPIRPGTPPGENGARWPRAIPDFLLDRPADAGLIIPASWNPSTPCRAHTVAPLMTEPILAGNASLDQTVQKKKSRTGIS